MRHLFRFRRVFLAALSGVLLVAVVSGAGATASTDSTCSFPDCPIAINDNTSAPATQDQAASPYPSEISFGHGDPCCGIIDKVTVTLTGLTHASLADLDVLLVKEPPPVGSEPAQVIELMSDVGTGSAATNLNLTFDDSARALPPTGPVVSGSYRPTNYPGTGTLCATDTPPSSATADPFPAPAPAPPSGGYGQSLGVFSGEELSSGTWHLYVGDDCLGGSGSISSWSLKFFLRNRDLGLIKTADNATVSPGSPIGFQINAFDGPEPSFGGARLDDPLPAGTGIDWSISPPFSGPGSCSITGPVGDETLSCDFAALPASVHVSSLTSNLSCGTYTNYAQLSSATYPPSGATASTTVSCPTSVTVTSFGANVTSRGVLVRWRISSEARMLGFNLFREQAGRRVKLNRALMPAVGAGHLHSRLDRRAPLGLPLRYWLQAVHLDGSRTWHGPRRLIRQ